MSVFPVLMPDVACKLRYLTISGIVGPACFTTPQSPLFAIGIVVGDCNMVVCVSLIFNEVLVSHHSRESYVLDEIFSDRLHGLPGGARGSGVGLAVRSGNSQLKWD
jgi:hypothetical protein